MIFSTIASPKPVPPVCNPRLSLWLDEGIASYLSNGNPPSNLYNDYYSGIPTFKQLQTKSPIKFSDMGGYDFAFAYIEYLDVTYGWTSVLTLLNTSNYERTFGKSAKRFI
ncbi:hypothetical protein JCM17380_29190 [Desulfosporosinus burensis]